MDRAMTSSYNANKLSIATMSFSICSSLAAILNAKLLPQPSFMYADIGANCDIALLAFIVAFDVAYSFR